MILHVRTINVYMTVGHDICMIWGMVSRSVRAVRHTRGSYIVSPLLLSMEVATKENKIVIKFVGSCHPICEKYVQGAEVRLTSGS